MEVKVLSSKLVKPRLNNAPSPATDEYHPSAIIYASPPAPSRRPSRSLATALAEYRALRRPARRGPRRAPAVLLNDRGARLVEADSGWTPTSSTWPPPSPPRGAPPLHPDSRTWSSTRWMCSSSSPVPVRLHRPSGHVPTTNFLVAWGPRHQRPPHGPPPRPPPRRALQAPRLPTRSTASPAPGDDDDEKQHSHAGEGAENNIVIHKAHFTKDFIATLTWQGVGGSWSRSGPPVADHDAGRGLSPEAGPPRRVLRQPRARAFPTATVADLLGRPLKHAAQVIHDEVARVDGGYFRSFVDFASSGAVEKEGLEPSAVCKDLADVPVLRVDFGTGSPAYFMPSYFPTEGIAVPPVDAFVPVFEHNLQDFRSAATPRMIESLLALRFMVVEGMERDGRLVIWLRRARRRLVWDDARTGCVPTKYQLRHGAVGGYDSPVSHTIQVEVGAPPLRGRTASNNRRSRSCRVAGPPPSFGVAQLLGQLAPAARAPLDAYFVPVSTRNNEAAAVTASRTSLSNQDHRDRDPSPHPRGTVQSRGNYLELECLRRPAANLGHVLHSNGFRADRRGNPGGSSIRDRHDVMAADIQRKFAVSPPPNPHGRPRRCLALAAAAGRGRRRGFPCAREGLLQERDAENCGVKVASASMPLLPPPFSAHGSSRRRATDSPCHGHSPCSVPPTKTTRAAGRRRPPGTETSYRTRTRACDGEEAAYETRASKGDRAIEEAARTIIRTQLLLTATIMYARIPRVVVYWSDRRCTSSAAEPDAPLLDIASQALQMIAVPMRLQEVDERSEQSREYAPQKLDRSSTPRVHSLDEGVASEAYSSGEFRARRTPERRRTKAQRSNRTFILDDFSQTLLSGHPLENPVSINRRHFGAVRGDTLVDASIVTKFEAGASFIFGSWLCTANQEGELQRQLRDEAVASTPPHAQIAPRGFRKTPDSDTISGSYPTRRSTWRPKQIQSRADHDNSAPTKGQDQATCPRLPGGLRITSESRQGSTIRTVTATPRDFATWTARRPVSLWANKLSRGPPEATQEEGSPTPRSNLGSCHDHNPSGVIVHWPGMDPEAALFEANVPITVRDIQPLLPFQEGRELLVTKGNKRTGLKNPGRQSCVLLSEHSDEEVVSDDAPTEEGETDADRELRIERNRNRALRRRFIKKKNLNSEFDKQDIFNSLVFEGFQTTPEINLAKARLEAAAAMVDRLDGGRYASKSKSSQASEQPLRQLRRKNKGHNYTSSNRREEPRPARIHIIQNDARNEIIRIREGRAAIQTVRAAQSPQQRTEEFNKLLKKRSTPWANARSYGKLSASPPRNRKRVETQAIKPVDTVATKTVDLQTEDPTKTAVLGSILTPAQSALVNFLRAKPVSRELIQTKLGCFGNTCIDCFGTT
ncbi:hypothetical protein HU200_011103 [Digitaria exilis]|uniref:Uncharacterized protein n=1 Tax=Digitaria exilis TaxID=1010633 RepID=A0A835FH69_9POAL|nr:hypothetical protein HU200_011103 [Digitaria exilis]